MTLFTATFCYSEREGESWIAGLADHAESPEHYVLFERAKYPSDQDKALNHDQTYIEINDQRFSEYGALEKIVMEARELTLYFKAGSSFSANGEETCLIVLGENIGEHDFLDTLRLICGDIFVASEPLT
jgi:hypothetical protein